MIQSTAGQEEETLRRLIQDVARHLVDDSEEIVVCVAVDDDGTTFLLKVAQSDVGKIIGKQGRTVRSIRTILNGIGMKLHKRYKLDILEWSHQEAYLMIGCPQRFEL